MAQLGNTIVNGNLKVLNGIQANTVSGSGTVEFIVGTQTAETGAFTGVTKDSSLYDGKTIFYYLPYNGSGNATLNLTLADGTTTTGAKVVYLTGTSRLTTHYGAGSCFHLTYRSSDDAWHGANYDSNSNTYDRTLHNSNILAASAITKAFVIVGDSAGYKNVASGVTFDITYPILYASAAIAAAAAAKSAYDIIPDVNLATTKASWTGTQYAMAYLVGSSLSGNTFTIDSTVFTTTAPTSADGKFYMPLGVMSTTTAVYFKPTCEVYQYTNGSFHKLDITTAAVGAFNGQVKINGSDITVYTHPSDGANTGSFGPSVNASPTHGGTFSVPYVTVNAAGHVTAASTKTITLPAAPTSVTSATKLGTARAIDGVNFDGSAAITHYGTCSTAAATAAKTVACTSYTLVTGSRIIIKFTVTNTAASPTLNVNSTGAKAIQYRGAAITAGYLTANRTYEFVYDGSNYQLVGDISGDVPAITNAEISTAWGSTDPVNSYIENNVYSMTDSEIIAAWNDVNVDAVTGDGTVNGDLYVNGDISTTDGNVNVDGDVYADHVYNAVYNDYAEYFPKGEETEPGDVIVLDLDSDSERYIKSREDNKIVVGVHTDEYAFLIGGNKVSKDENTKYFIPVSLAGRVKVKFTGKSKKGCYVVASELYGVARLYRKGEDEPEQIFGILVEEDNKEDEIRRLRIKLK